MEDTIRTEELLLLNAEGFGALGTLLKGYSQSSGLIYLQSYRLCLAQKLATAQVFDLLRVTYLPPNPPRVIGQLLEVSEIEVLSHNVSNSQSIAAFEAEVLDLVLQRDLGDKRLYRFLLQEQTRLRFATEGISTLSHFLWTLIDLLGYRPQGTSFSKTTSFNLKNGRWEGRLSPDTLTFSPRASAALLALWKKEKGTSSASSRLLRDMLSYLCYHLELPLPPERWRRLYGLLCASRCGWSIS